MFVDVVPNRNSRPTILIRQAYRESGKARKRTLANITKLPPDVVEKIRKILSGADPADAPARLEDAFTISRSLQHGNAAAVLALAGSGGRLGRAADSGAGIEARRRPALPAGDGGLHIGVAARPAGERGRGPTLRNHGLAA